MVWKAHIVEPQLVVICPVVVTTSGWQVTWRKGEGEVDRKYCNGFFP
jgi:hypothetical protein